MPRTSARMRRAFETKESPFHMKSVQPLALVLLFGIAPSGALLAQTCMDGATKCVTEPGGGDCSSIGKWDAASKTCTLTGDLTGESIQIAGDGITLDGAGHTLTGASVRGDRKSTRLNSSHLGISYAVF